MLTTENIVIGILVWSWALWVIFGRHLKMLIRPMRINLNPIPDDFTPRILYDNDYGGVTVKIGNTAHYIVTTEKDALAMEGVRDERKKESVK